ncbi:MAG TPA: NAD-dependent epimerase/dehydratase family protein, partial [Segetibacter sp.]
MIENLSEPSHQEIYVQDASRGGCILVTGGTGLVGSHLIRELVRAGKKIKALYRNTIPESEVEKVQWIKGDILDVIFLQEVMRDVQLVYHCAAIVSFHPAHKKSMFAINIEGTANVVNAAITAGVKKLCYVSSVAALGKPEGTEEVNENTRWNEKTNSSNYSKSKYFAEIEVWRGVGEGLKAVIVNPVIILGAGNWNDSSTKIFKTAYGEFPWYTEGVAGFVDVNDVIKAMICLMESKVNAQKFILCGENRKYKEIFTAIAEAFDKKPPHKRVSRFVAGIVWRLEGLKSFFNHNEPLLTKETAEAAIDVVRY